MTVDDLIGSYQITGTNQDDDATSGYSGILTLSLDSDNRVIAEWLINQTQVQTGNGFFKDDLLVIHFKYVGYGQQIFKGIVVYRCHADHTLHGFWSEKHGDPKFLGSELGIKIQ